VCPLFDELLSTVMDELSMHELAMAELATAELADYNVLVCSSDSSDPALFHGATTVS
jgi:hypothetical protein